MIKPGIKIEIPGFGELHIRAVCSDYTGTLSYGGKLLSGVSRRLRQLSMAVDVHVVSSDTRKTASKELKALRQARVITLTHKIVSKRHDTFKRDYVKNLVKDLGINLKDVAVLGNGMNDKLWLECVRYAGGLSIAVDAGEGCAIEALQSANVFVTGSTNALDLLLDKKRLVGTMRTEEDKQ